MNYKTYSPDTALSAFIKCYWTLDFPKESIPEKQRIVPDGCMEMIFHGGDPYKQYMEDESYLIQPQSFVFGQITQPLYIEPTGDSAIFAVRFHPEGFIAFATIPVNEMENKAIPLKELFKEDGQHLGQAILNSSSAEEKIKIVESFLLKKLSTQEASDRIVRAGVEVIMQLNGQISVGELSEQMKINRRQLERKFSSVIGLSPKQLSKITRLQSTLKMLATKQFTSLTDVAYENNYYDQAHFIKDFKEFTGMSPKKFYAGNLKLSALFINDE